METLSKYAVRGTLGRGAMGTVYDGWDPIIDRRVAIKTVRLAADHEDEEMLAALDRFKREAQAAGRLSHPNIVGVYDYGETDEVAYIVMEFVEGTSLKSVLDKRRRLEAPEACAIMAQLLAALAYSHGRGVVHRDIKPANVMMATDGNAKIADFGIARIESSSMTSVGTVMGTPAYMPPEQFLGEAADARSDIYAAGVMLFHLLTGERPYEGTMSAIMQKVLNDEAPPAASARAAVPVAYDAVIARAMAKAPAARFQTAADFAAALREAASAPAGAPAAGADDDATMIAPARPRAPAAKPIVVEDTFFQPMAGPPSRYPAETLPPAPPPPAAPPARRVQWLLPAAGAAILTLGAGAWFALHGKTATPVIAGTAPTPNPILHDTLPITPRPILHQPAPAASPQAVLAAASLPCTALSAGNGEGTLQLTGLAGTDEAAAARAAATRAAGTTPLNWSVQEVPTRDCPALDLVHTVASPLGITIGGAAQQARLAVGSAVLLQIDATPFDAVVRVDDLANDGTASHLAPLAGAEATLRPQGAALPLRLGCVSPPFGQDLLLAVASSQPLFSEVRPAAESAASYLAALSQAIATTRQNGGTVRAGLILLQTERGTDASGPQRAVVDYGAPLFTAPSDHATPAAKMDTCAPATIDRQTGTWLHITAPTRTGWVQERHVARLGE